jgi:hypothetical protein
MELMMGTCLALSSNPSATKTRKKGINDKLGYVEQEWSFLFLNLLSRE